MHVEGLRGRPAEDRAVTGDERRGGDAPRDEGSGREKKGSDEGRLRYRARQARRVRAPVRGTQRHVRLRVHRGQVPGKFILTLVRAISMTSCFVHRRSWTAASRGSNASLTKPCVARFTTQSS